MLASLLAESEAEVRVQRLLFKVSWSLFVWTQPQLSYCIIHLQEGNWKPLLGSLHLLLIKCGLKFIPVTVKDD